MSEGTVEVLFFAAARERVGVGSQRLTVASGSTLGDLIDRLVGLHPTLAPLLPYLRLAVNEAFVADRARTLVAGDVVALIPPVSGGRGRTVLTDQVLDPLAVERAVRGPDRGGVVTFTGCVRDHTGDHGVVRLEYEAYRAMALKVMQAILEETEAKFPPVQVAMHHRLGVLEIGEAAVVVSAAAPHRAPAFAACAYATERLKEDVPIFKREVRSDGTVWVGLGP